MKIALGIFIALTVIAVNSLEQTEETGINNVEEIGLARANRSPEARRHGRKKKRNLKKGKKCGGKNKNKCKKRRNKKKNQQKKKRMEKKRKNKERKRQLKKKKKNENKKKRRNKSNRTKKKIQKSPQQISRQKSDSTCIDNIITTMGYVGKQIKNFNQQKNRLEAFEKIVNKKGGKKGNFANATSYLSTVAGNNSCGSSSSSANATSNFNTLNNCSSSIGESCVIPNGTVDTSALDSCQASLKKVTTKQDECYTTTIGVENSDYTAACTCWSEAATLVNTTKALKCSAKSTLTAVTGFKKSCQTKFGACKSAEDEAPGLINTCNGGNTTTIGNTTTTVTTKSPSAAATTAAAAGTSGKTVVWPLLTSPVTGGYKYTKVFGLGIFAENSISDAKFQHLASVFAEWLDNDEDGCFDNPTLLTKWLALKPLPVTTAFKSDQSIPSDDFPVKGFKVASAVYDNELLPNCSGTAATVNCADATLEEVLHLVTAEGYTQLNSSVFATESTANSKLTLAMDVARGGKFTTIPSPYPTGAWYTYNDASCKYGCQATEYIYWGISAYVGALAGRKAGITDEWDFATRAELKAGDVKLTAIIEDTSSYKLPKISPDGKYKGPLTCAIGTNHGGT